ncbi:hypothetical protein BD414DRAFT_536591 [Trametes punicea]|nr:hypothetical protein BD414DRAFT_536591 [Trametes punicea]
MSVITKDIVISAGDLKNQPVKITLAFIPPTADFTKVVPIAWRVFDLSDNATFNWTWNNILGACHADIDSDTGVVTPGEYTSLPIGDTSDLHVDITKRPPVYWFTDPSPFGQQTARVVNRTGSYADIGGGFIVNSGQSNEDIEPVLVCRSVPDGNSAYVNYTPILKLWVSLDYEESELLDVSIKDVPPLWQGDVSRITGKTVTINVKRDDNGSIVVDGPKGAVLEKTPGLAPHTLVYKVDLAFAVPGLVSEGVRAIVKQLAGKGYTFRSTTKGYDTETQLILTLPETVSCNQAEFDMVGAIEASPSIYGKAFVKGHSGAALLSSDDDIEKWVEINPASPQWFGATQSGAGKSAAFDGTNGQAFDKAANKNVGGKRTNGTASGFLAAAGKQNSKVSAAPDSGTAASGGEPAAIPEDVKFRSIRRGGGRRSTPLAA